MSKTILITGASSGIGKATAKLFQSRGWNVAATMRAPEPETELSNLDRVHLCRLDLEDRPSISAAIQSSITAFGRIDVLLNNAGYGAYGLLEATPMEKIDRQFQVNVLGLLEASKAVLPHFREQKDGIIINVSSIGGKMTFPLGTLYHGSKFAVEGLSEALHYELKSIGVRVKLIEPGVIKTDFAGRSFDFSNDPSLEAYQPIVHAFFKTLAPMAEAAASPEIVAETIFEAATDNTSKLRYEVGTDAVQLLAARKALDDEAFFGMIQQQFGFSS